LGSGFNLSFSTEGRKKQGNSKMRSIYELALAKITFLYSWGDNGTKNYCFKDFNEM